MQKPFLKLLFFIIDWDKAKAVSDVFGERRFVFMSKGLGTASSEILDLLGLGNSDKAVILCLKEGKSTELVDAVRAKLGARSVGAGIVFTIPLSGINAPVMQLFLESITVEEKDETMEGKVEIKNDLIMAILNHGYSDDFMATARSAGARGGTVISARGISQQKVKKFLGISVQDEKEIIIILADREKKVPIMQAVSGAFGPSSKAEGMVFSLPVDQVMSLNQQF
jgi:nitrogen regulatory protein PII